MKYVGSKARILKHILPTIQYYADRATVYVEPFVGGANVACHIEHKNKKCYDNHPYLIFLLNALKDGWIPPNIITEEEYKTARKKYSSGTGLNYIDGPLIGFIGFCCSYSGKWWGGYARGNDSKGIPRNYADEAARHLVKQGASLKHISFSCNNYKDLLISWGSLIYCDPPYENTTKYSTGNFNHDEFWEWCRQKGKNNTVLVSEYNAPDDFECLVEVKGLCSSLTQETGSKKATEKLFICKG